MRKLAVALSCMVFVLGVCLGVRWLYPRLAVAVVAGKMPRKACATVLKKEHVRLSDKEQTLNFPNERFYVYTVSMSFTT
jgi:hypothetical protein